MAASDVAESWQQQQQQQQSTTKDVAAAGGSAVGADTLRVGYLAEGCYWTSRPDSATKRKDEEIMLALKFKQASGAAAAAKQKAKLDATRTKLESTSGTTKSDVTSGAKSDGMDAASPCAAVVAAAGEFPTAIARAIPEEVHSACGSRSHSKPSSVGGGSRCASKSSSAAAGRRNVRLSASDAGAAEGVAETAAQPEDQAASDTSHGRRAAGQRPRSSSKSRNSASTATGGVGADRPSLSGAAAATAGRLRPQSALPTTAAAARGGSGTPSPSSSSAPRSVPVGSFGNAPWVRANVLGRARVPKMKTDEVKLKKFFEYCRDGNFRDVKAMAMHYPYLLWLTDPYGFSALHHAAMSKSEAFVGQVMELYHDPRNYVRKVVTYDCDFDFLADEMLLCDVTTEPDASKPVASLGLHKPLIVLQHINDKSLAQQAGVLPGDVLYAVCKANSGKRCMLPEDFLLGALGEKSREGWWPLSLEFRGPACSEILAVDGWTPGHGAAGIGPACRGVLGVLMDEARLIEATPLDTKGCTVQEWVQLERKATTRKGPRRPLSAGATRRRVHAPIPVPSRGPGSPPEVYAASHPRPRTMSDASLAAFRAGPVVAECAAEESAAAQPIFPGVLPPGPPCCFDIPVW